MSGPQQEPTITLQLPLGAVNYVLNTLGTRPFAEVNGLVQSIQRQAQAQVEPQTGEKEEQPAATAG